MQMYTQTVYQHTCALHQYLNTTRTRTRTCTRTCTRKLNCLAVEKLHDDDQTAKVHHRSLHKEKKAEFRDITAACTQHLHPEPKV